MLMLYILRKSITGDIGFLCGISANAKYFMDMESFKELANFIELKPNLPLKISLA